MFLMKNPCSEACPPDTPTLLGKAPTGFKGTILAIDASACAKLGLETFEIEHRLIEMGFVEGASVEIRHEGFWNRDPIAVKVHNATIALRRKVANAIRVLPLPHGASTDSQ